MGLSKPPPPVAVVASPVLLIAKVVIFLVSVLILDIRWPTLGAVLPVKLKAKRIS